MKFHFLESVLQSQSLLTESLHANKGHNTDDIRMAPVDCLEQNEVLDGTFASHVSDATRAFANVCEYLCFSIYRFTQMK